jgi:biopolymer transport protein ExbB/TolQ
MDTERDADVSEQYLPVPEAAEVAGVALRTAYSHAKKLGRVVNGKVHVQPSALSRAAGMHAAAMQGQGAAARMHSAGGSASEAVATALERLELLRLDALQTKARHEIVRLERGLVVLEIIVGIAPLLGLVGTIVGMMAVFADVGQAGLTDASKLAHGIALILRATLLGLLIAIPSLIAWSYFSKKVEMFAVEMETLCDEFMRRQYREQSQNNPPPLAESA